MPQIPKLDADILGLVKNHEIYEQSDLQKMLKNLGYNISQATLSRRLKKLKAVKVSGSYKIIDFNLQTLSPVLAVKVSEFGIVVLHTQPGHANSLAYFFDNKYVKNQPENNRKSVILGTIAGDDTVLLIAKNKSSIIKILSLIKKEFPYLV